MYRVRFTSAIAITLACLILGCGSGGSTPTPTVLALNGNYNFTASSQVVSNFAFIGGPLQSNPTGSVTATMHIDDPSNCFALTSIPTFTGTINSQGQLSVTSNNVQSKVINVTAAVSPDGKTITNGTYNITGTACAAGDHGTVTGFLVQPFTGTFSGTFTSSGGTANVSANVTQSSTADASGLYQLTGIVALSGTPCFTSATVSSSGIAGVLMLLNLNANDGSTITFAGVASDGTAKNITGTFSISGGTGGCSGESGTGTLSRP
jgi:hypothetical protein